jgi:hypothetical protein
MCVLSQAQEWGALDAALPLACMDFVVGGLEVLQHREAHLLLSQHKAIKFCVRALQYHGVFAGTYMAVCMHRWSGPVSVCAHKAQFMVSICPWAQT